MLIKNEAKFKELGELRAQVFLKFILKEIGPTSITKRVPRTLCKSALCRFDGGDISRWLLVSADSPRTYRLHMVA